MTDEIYLGLMSGTSLDAIDAVAVSFANGFRIIATYSMPMPEDTRASILALTLPGSNEIDRMGEVDIQLGVLFGTCVNRLLEESGIERRLIRAIGSHGQTIRHRPGRCFPFTLQIGDPNVIAENTGITVVADFRRRDMAAGGQGAPLVPAFHQAIFRSRDRDRVILNLGGIANITLLPADLQQPVGGYDTGPANILMDAWCRRIRHIPYDLDGEWAASGNIKPGLLERMLTHPFFSQKPPKSTGREEFNIDWLDSLLAEESDRRPEDIQATLSELTARSVADAVTAAGMNRCEMVVCGGGAYNQFLMQRLSALLPDCQINNSMDYGVAPTWIEASAFAWLARQAMLELSGNIPEVTGARGERILGGVYPA
ncbi:MAG TPA: anhydro-N-acetylmuramic acid kinase [Fluviicoccus sp.]|nr:anhydro-N-acetylmuramic acid kinase [Fluviicoccus sp.]